MPEVHIKRDYSIPAAIQFKNSGAMWPGATATKWGSTKWQYLADGTGQGGNGKGNKIAIFDTWVDGISAQLDLWRTSPKYKNKRFADAIRVWSGGNNVPSYIAYVKARVPGITENTVMDDAFWKSPMGIQFLKAQSGHEAGRAIPATDADWIAAQKRVFSGVPTVNTVKKAATSIVAGTVTGTAAGTHAGLGLGTAFLIGLGIALVIFLVWKFKPSKEPEATAVAPPPVDVPVPAVPAVPTEPVK